MASIAIPVREPNGRPKRKALSQREREIVGVGLAQPHRKGAKFPEHEWRCELFGRLILDRGWGFDEGGYRLKYGPDDLWNAGNRFKRDHRRYLRAKHIKEAWENENRPAPRTTDEAIHVMTALADISTWHRTFLVFGTIPNRCRVAAIAYILDKWPEDFVPDDREAESTYDALVALAKWYGR